MPMPGFNLPNAYRKLPAHLETARQATDDLRRRQRPYMSSAAYGPFGCSCSPVKSRPISGRIPNVRRKLAATPPQDMRAAFLSFRSQSPARLIERDFLEDGLMLAERPIGARTPNHTRRSACTSGSSRNRMWSTALKTAVTAPAPRAMVRTAIANVPRDPRKLRHAYRAS